jgi:hypothetical protein
MTKPANFPGRKDARRRRALVRLAEAAKKPKARAEVLAEAIANTQAKLVANASSIQTKKVRGVGGKRLQTAA